MVGHVTLICLRAEGNYVFFIKYLLSACKMAHFSGIPVLRLNDNFRL